MSQLFRLMTLMLILTAILLFSNGVVESRVISEKVDTGSDTVFIDRFVFMPQDTSIFRYDIKYRKFLDETDSTADKMSTIAPQAQPQSQTRPRRDGDDKLIDRKDMANEKSENGDQVNYFYRLVIYDDNPDQWPYVRANEEKMTCREKQDVAIKGGRPVITLSPHSNGVCKEFIENGIPMIHCQGWRTWSGYPSARWWFITLQNCGTYPQEGVRATYSITLTNGDNTFNQHFSADKTYTFETCCVFLIANVLLLVTSLCYSSCLKKLRVLHVTFKLFVWSIFLQLTALVCLTTSLGLYARNGIDDWHALEVLGHVLSSLGTLLFILMTILVAKGYTITRAKISTQGSIKITVFMFLYSLVYGVLYFYKEVMADPRDVMYLFDSPAGNGLIALRFFGTVWLTYAIVITLKHFPQKKTFYFVFAVYFKCWFLAEPVMILITNYYIESYQRAKIVNGCYWLVTFMGHMFWLMLTWPNRANKNFPYHLRSNQVGFLEVGPSSNNPGLDDVFMVENPRNKYIVPPVRPKRNNFFPEVNRRSIGALAAAKNTNYSLCTRHARTLAGNLPTPMANTDYSIFIGNALSKVSTAGPCSTSGGASSKPSNKSSKRQNRTITLKIKMPPAPSTDFSIFQVNTAPKVTETPISASTTKPATVKVDMDNADSPDKPMQALDQDVKSEKFNTPSTTALAGDIDSIASMVSIPLTDV